MTITLTKRANVKNNYDIVDSQAFDLESLKPGEIGVECEKLVERSPGGNPVIELTARIYWAADEENQQHIGEAFKWPLFFGPNQDQTPRILKDLFKRAGFDVASWKAENDLPMSQMLPGAIKLLVYKKVPVIGKVTASTRDGKTRNFFNPTKIAREQPDGTPYPDALPDPVPNDLVAEAYAAVLPGDSADSLV